MCLLVYVDDIKMVGRKELSSNVGNIAKEDRMSRASTTGRSSISWDAVIEQPLLTKQRSAQTPNFFK